MDSKDHIGQRLLTAYDDLPRGERRLADLLLEDLGLIRYSSAGELAARAGVSKATASRLFHRLGYSGFRAILQEVRESPPVSPVSHENPLGDVPLSMGAYLDAEVQHLIRTFEVLRPDDLTRAVKLLRDGEKLWVVGFGEDYPIAHFARSLLIKLRPDIRMIPLGGFPIPEEFASITDKDTVLALGAGRRTQDFHNVVSSAAEAGARIVLVTGTLAKGDQKNASVILRGRTSGPTLFGSLTAPISLVTYLCARLASELGFPAADRLRAIASIHAEWDEVEDDDA
ncbi:MurR/RpiR family transcriptional regulator [Mesobacterium pallidum]|uniref:MurR/RpiR family transcriptional regulator n=1 Tax=Mesobacterium pallidum TaxID=2872037 RepID=UPI001EE32D7D|nr:MurR/RpiR family transcriptional regulator [Mesobacterium pallidum]